MKSFAAPDAPPFVRPESVNPKSQLSGEALLLCPFFQASIHSVPYEKETQGHESLPCKPPQNGIQLDHSALNRREHGEA